jgi:hypothetical protein
MMSHQAVSSLKVPKCSGGLQITRERGSAGAMPNPELPADHASVEARQCRSGWPRSSGRERY